jgi:hypothetical protein
MPVIFSYEFELHGIAMVATSRGGLIDITIGQLLPSAIGRGEDGPAVRCHRGFRTRAPERRSRVDQGLR